MLLVEIGHWSPVVWSMGLGAASKPTAGDNADQDEKKMDERPCRLVNVGDPGYLPQNPEVLEPSPNILDRDQYRDDEYKVGQEPPVMQGCDPALHRDQIQRPAGVCVEAQAHGECENNEQE